jgi:hypothetical protein
MADNQKSARLGCGPVSKRLAYPVPDAVLVERIRTMPAGDWDRRHNFAGLAARLALLPCEERIEPLPC